MQEKRVRKRIEAKPASNRLKPIEDEKPVSKYADKKRSLARDQQPMGARFSQPHNTKPWEKVPLQKGRPNFTHQSVYERLEAVDISRGRHTMQDRQLIGQKVCDAFYRPVDDRKKNTGAYKKLMQEPEGQFMVMVYPYFFVRVIDSIIYHHFTKR